LPTDSPFVTLKPVGTPKPTYFPCYILNNRGNRSDTRKFVDYDGENLKIGRKIYLKHQDELLDYASQKRSNLNSTVRLIPEGCGFDFSVDFESLTNYELGLLLYAVSASYKGEALPFRIGMGKPLGLGVAKVEITSVEILKPLEWYAGLSGDGKFALSPYDINRLKEAYSYVQEASDGNQFLERMQKVSSPEIAALDKALPENQAEIYQAVMSKGYIREYHLFNSLNNLADHRLGLPICYAPGVEKGFQWYQNAKGDLKQRLFDPGGLEASLDKPLDYSLSRI